MRRAGRRRAGGRTARDRRRRRRCSSIPSTSTHSQARSNERSTTTRRAPRSSTTDGRASQPSPGRQPPRASPRSTVERWKTSRDDHRAGRWRGRGALPRRAGAGGTAGGDHRDRQHRRRRRAARPPHQPRPRHRHLHPRRGHQPRDGLGARRGDVAGHGRAAALWRVRPLARAGATWFRLGDRDLATHLYRTHRLDEGASLVGGDRRDRRGVGARPAHPPDDATTGSRRVSIVAGEGEIGFQEYFVGRQHTRRRSTAVRFDGVERARPGSGRARRVGGRRRRS